MVVEQGVKLLLRSNQTLYEKSRKNDSRNMPITWVSGRAEKTGLNTASCDWLTMASCCTGLILTGYSGVQTLI